MTAPGVLDAAGDRQLEGGYAEFDGFLWLVARRDFRYWFAFVEDEERTLTWPSGKLYLLLGTKGEVRWDVVITPKGTQAALHVPASEVAKVSDGWPWDLCFEHQGGKTEIVAEGFVKVQDGCGGVSKPLLPVVVRPAPIVGIAPPPPKPKAWVVAPNDNQQHEWAGVWTTPLTLPAPVKGSLVLSVDNTVDPGNATICVAVYDGTAWRDLFASQALGGSRTTPSFAWWHADRTRFDDPSFDPEYLTDIAIAWGQADGVHVVWCRGSGGTPIEQVLAYPAGVTLADMPPSKTF